MNAQLQGRLASRGGARARQARLASHGLTLMRPNVCTVKAASSSGASTSQPTSTFVTFEEVQLAAQRRGLDLSVKDLGPFYRVVCRDGGKDGRILGMTNGFVAPWFGIMHCDMLQIFTRGMKGEAGERVRGGLLGLGLLLGGATFAYGFRRGCRTAEILAINDDDAWHDRLVRYYSYFGFRTVCKVGGNGLSDVPHMLVWGGEGTRMDADIEAMLGRWTPALRAEAEGGRGRGVSAASAADADGADSSSSPSLSEGGGSAAGS